MYKVGIEVRKVRTIVANAYLRVSRYMDMNKALISYHIFIDNSRENMSIGCPKT